MKYLSRSLVCSPYYIGLCQSEKAFRAETRRLKVPKKQRPEFLPAGSDACVHFFERHDGKLLAIVCIGSVSGRSAVEVYGLLVHEAVHVWQAICSEIGEDRPSAEFEAYAIQSIAQELMQALRLKAPKKKG